MHPSPCFLCLYIPVGEEESSAVCIETVVRAYSRRTGKCSDLGHIFQLDMHSCKLWLECCGDKHHTLVLRKKKAVLSMSWPGCLLLRAYQWWCLLLTPQSPPSPSWASAIWRPIEHCQLLSVPRTEVMEKWACSGHQLMCNAFQFQIHSVCTHLQVKIEIDWGSTLLTGGCWINWLWKTCITFGDVSLILIISFHCQDAWYSKYIFSDMLALLLLVLVQTSWSQFHEHPRPITATAGDGQHVKLGQWHQAKNNYNNADLSELQVSYISSANNIHWVSNLIKLLYPSIGVTIIIYQLC